ncbi:MAG TPA: tetratricopeptide repeat protein [Opitutaceae bacterium]|nr:tetratricopeptide repeat protein [Opitutaceae bacterium]
MQRRLWLLGLGLVLLVALAYTPTYRAGFIWNDSDYVTTPALQSWDGLGKIWTKIGATEQYYPVLHSAFWIQHRLWGDSAMGYHVATVVWHALAVVLLWQVFKSLGVRGAWFGAALFAVHPVCVESVAWVSEQKNTLSLFLYLAAALFYLRFDRERRKRDYALASAFFVLALLSKSVTATLAPALWVALWWKKGHLDWRKDIVPLLPWLVTGAAFGLVTAWVEHSVVGARGERFDLTWLQRGLLAGWVTWFYLGKLIWPANLIFIYPRWEIDPTAITHWIPSIAVIALLSLSWWLRSRNRSLLAAILFFLGSLFPVMGFMNVYAFMFSYVADHWQYLPSIGVFALAGAALSRLFVNRTKTIQHRAFAAGACLIVTLGVLTWRQSGLYRDIETFYRLTLEKNPNSWMSRNNLGLLLLETHRLPEAVEHLRAAAHLHATAAEPWNNLGVALQKSGHTAESIDTLREALRRKSDYPEATFNLAVSLAKTGSREEAKSAYTRAIGLRSAYPEAENNLGKLLLDERRFAEAAAHFNQAIIQRPDFSQARHNLAMTWLALGKTNNAIEELSRVAETDPDATDSRWILSVVLTSEKRGPEAIPHLEKLVAQQPLFADAHLLLAQLLWETDRARAIPLRDRGLELQRAQPN